MSGLSSTTLVEHGDVGVLSLGGDFGIDSVDVLRSSLVNAFDGSFIRIVLDLSGVGVFDSSALGVMIAGSKRARNGGGWLRLAGAPPHLRRVLRVTHIDTVIGVYNTVAEAVKADC